MKIALIVGYIRTGGFETFLLNILNTLKSSDIVLDIYYFELPNNIKKEYSKHNYIKLSNFTKLDKLISILKPKVIIQLIRERRLSNKFYCVYLSQLAKRTDYIYKEYAKVISLSEQLNLYLNSNFQNANKRICWIHPNYSLAKFDKSIDSKYLQNFDEIYSVSYDGAETLKKEFPELTKKIDYIENILNLERIKNLSNVTIHNPFRNNSLKLLTVCRMANDSKRVDRLLEIAKSLEEENFNYNWVFIGDGPDLSSYKMYVKKHNLTKVFFLGSKGNPYPYFKMADLFILLSEYEGNPYVLKEARALSLPYLITDFDVNLINSKLNCFGVSRNGDVIQEALNFIKQFKPCVNHNKLNQINDIKKLLKVFSVEENLC